MHFLTKTTIKRSIVESCCEEREEGEGLKLVVVEGVVWSFSIGVAEVEFGKTAVVEKEGDEVEEKVEGKEDVATGATIAVDAAVVVFVLEALVSLIETDVVVVEEEDKEGKEWVVVLVSSDEAKEEEEVVVEEDEEELVEGSAANWSPCKQT